MIAMTKAKWRTCLVLGATLAVPACDRLPWARTPPADTLAAPAATRIREDRSAKPWFTPSPPQSPGVHLAYTHAVSLQVGGGALGRHFTAARDRCLNTPALHCILLHASLDAVRPNDVGAPATQSADLRLRLPHDQIAPFANALTDALPGETAGLARVLGQSTDAEDLSQPVRDVAQRTAQLSDYLASLKTLGGRLTISVSDLVKIAGETAQAQSQIEAVQAEQRALSLRVDTEALDVSFIEPAPAVAAPDPVNETWSQASATFRASAAQVLQVSIGALPWLPVLLVVVLLLALSHRLIFGRRRRAPPVVRVVS